MLIVSVAAQDLVLRTTYIIGNNETRQAEFTVTQGTLMLDASTTQGNLNVTVFQNNVSRVSLQVAPLEGIRSTNVSIDTGEIQVVLTVSNLLFLAVASVSLNMTLIESGSIQNNGLLVAAGSLIVLSLPLVYIIGRNRNR